MLLLFAFEPATSASVSESTDREIDDPDFDEPDFEVCVPEADFAPFLGPALPTPVAASVAATPFGSNFDFIDTLAEIGLAEIGLAEIGFAEIGFAEIGAEAVFDAPFFALLCFDPPTGTAVPFS